MKTHDLKCWPETIMQASKGAGPYSIGSKHWPGLSKLAEEAGEVLQVIGKLLGTGGEAAHWDGSDLRARLVEEMGDLMAACAFVADHNGLDDDAVLARAERKREQFEKWHRDVLGLHERTHQTTGEGGND